MKYARFDDNDIVIEVITWVPFSSYVNTIANQFESVPDNVRENWKLNRETGEWTEYIIPEEPILPTDSLAALKEKKIYQIDQETSSAILSGFTYTIKDKERFFSYDSFDQQNFVDTASAAILSQVQSSVSGIPITVNWNSYVGEEKTLEVITLNATEFLDLYINGALVHKNTQMSIGGQRKLQVKEAQSWEEIDAI